MRPMRNLTGREKYPPDSPCAFRWPEEGDRIRVWYRSLHTDSSVPKAIVGTVTSTRQGSVAPSICFDGDDKTYTDERDPVRTDRYQLSDRAKRGIQIARKQAQYADYDYLSYRQISRNITAISTLGKDERRGTMPPYPAFFDRDTIRNDTRNNRWKRRKLAEAEAEPSPDEQEVSDREPQSA